MDERTPGPPPAPAPEGPTPTPQKDPAPAPAASASKPETPRQDPATTPSAHVTTPAHMTPAHITPSQKKGKRPPGVPPPPDLTVQIPGYTLEKRLGAGGMGDVYLAKQASLDRLVAIKLLPPDLARDKSYVEHFLKEARSAAKVTHENIMGAVDCGEAHGRYYFVMEYVAGETLFKQIHKQQRIPEARALEITRQVARGLRHALQHGLIHRDIKPKNILITAEGTAKLCDFGLARDISAAENQAEEEFLHTTPAYASPEQCRGESKLDHRTDLYSLGVTLFEMLTGRRPFQAATSRELMTKQVTEAPPAPRSLNPELSEAANKLVLRLLRKQPAERFKNYDELLAAIDAIVGVRNPEGAKKKKTTLVLAGAGAAVVLVGVVLAVALSGGKPPPPPPPAEPAAKAPAVDPAIQKLIDETAAAEKAAEGNPSDYAAVGEKWRTLEEKYRGTPNGGLFASRRMDFERHLAKEADLKAAEILGQADKAQLAGRPGDALRALKAFPPEFAETAAGRKIASRELELARLVDAKFSTGMQLVSSSLAAGKFEESSSQLNALRAGMSADGSLRPEFDQQMEQMRVRIAEETAMAKKKAETPQPGPTATPAVTPGPADPKNVVPPAVPDPSARTPKSGKGARAPAPPSPALAAALAVLANPADRVDPAKRGEAAAFFAVQAPKSAFFRAASYFLSKNEKDWKVEGAVKTALDEYLATPELASAETMTPEQIAAILTALAQKIAGCAGAPADALQFFVCAHLDDLVTRKGKPDPQVLAQAGLAKAGSSDLWGPAAGLNRIEMARFLVHAPGLWIAKAAEASASAPDFPTRALGTLLVAKDAAFDPLQASDRWKKLGAGAPDPGWTKVCDTLAERFKQSTTCEVCLGQGKYSCSACNGQGAALCLLCKGTGKVLDPAEGGKVTCTTCKGRGGAACAQCNGQKSVKCANCDGKKTKPGLAGGAWRWIADLGLCNACDGEGSLFKSAAWPCPVCDGNGRNLDQLPRDFAKVPAWIRTREGRALFNALRWLARHQAPDGSWGTTKWSASCREPGCVAPAGRPADFDIGETCLALVAFVSAGLGPESDLELGNVQAGQVIRRAIGWLCAQQRPADGMIAHAQTIKPVYENLLATYALFTVANSITPSEAFTDKDKAALRDAAFKALKAALALQNKGAGWGYTPQAPSDSWVTSWGAAALLAARDAGVDVQRVNLQWITQWYDSVTDKKDAHLGYSPTQMGRVNLTGGETFLHHDTLSAFGGMMRTQIEGKATATVAAADRLILTDLPNPDPLRRDFCYWYLGTTFLAQREKRTGTGWKAWAESALRESLALQQQADTCTLGSWLPDDRWSLMGGKVYATAINALLMEQIQGLAPAKAAKTK